MKIGIVIGRIGGVDGVALETEKWITVLEQRLGHEVYIISGEFEGGWRFNSKYHTLFPLLSFFSVEAEWGQKKAFFEPDESPKSFFEHLEKASELVYERLSQWIKDNKIDVVLSENASALPAHLSMGYGIYKLIERTGLPIVTHDHDFHWERGQRYRSVHEEINQFVDNHFPLNLKGVKHAVINHYAVETLRKHLGVDSVLVPNVMDFDEPFGVPTEENKYFLRQIGVADDEIALLQVTRIVRRKGIETAIKLIDRLNDKKVKLVITGNPKDDMKGQYYKELLLLTHQLNLDEQVIFAADFVQNNKNLSDVYAHGRACTYFSTYEGFGNAFVEAVLAKKPIFVNNYKPVFMPDIGSKGFKTVILEDNNLTNEKVKQMAEIIYNPKLCKEIAEYNFILGKKYFSFDVLEEKLKQLFH
jgi:glycosyltransferase involved in cell wall biosynthesis